MLKNRIISLKYDGATKNKKHFLLINAQIHIDSKIRLFHLGTTHIKESLTSKCISDSIITLLESYSINTNQILTITVDNANNMIASIKEINKVAQNTLRICNYQNISNNNNICVYTMRCGTHTFQLGINIYLKKYIDICICVRKIAKNLRTSKYRRKIEINKLNQVVDEIDTRWFSFYLVLKSILALKEFILKESGKRKELFLENDTWVKLYKFSECLRIMYCFNLKIQSSELVLT